MLLPLFASKFENKKRDSSVRMKGGESGYEARTQTFHNLSDPFDTSKVTHSIAEKRKPKISFLNVVRKKHDENWI